MESLQTAFLGEIEAILVAVRGPARKAAEAWEKRENLADHKFYYPHAVFDGNVARLGELHDKKLVRDIVYLYARLEHAREEGRRLEANTSDSEGRLRYVNYLCAAFSMSINLIIELSGELPKINFGNTEEARRFNATALKLDTDFLTDTTAKVWEAMLPQPVPPKKTP